MLGYDATGSPIKLAEPCSVCGQSGVEQAFSETFGFSLDECEGCHQEIKSWRERRANQLFPTPDLISLCEKILGVTNG